VPVNATAPVRSRSRHGLPLALAGGIVLVVTLAVWLRPSASSSSDGGTYAQAATRAAFTERSGVRVVRVALTGGGGIIDFRYAVVDANKAAHVHHTTPVLVDEDSREVIDTFFMGHRHGRNVRPKAGHTYPLLYINEQGVVDRGDRVTVVIGHSQLEHVVVR
jgi:hypothetical protein